jgi:hypothetical protein
MTNGIMVKGMARIAMVRAIRYTPVRKVDQVTSTKTRDVGDLPIASINSLIKAAHTYGKLVTRTLSAST